MIEDEARERVRREVGGAALARLERLRDLVIAENRRQNLISEASVEAIWCRHILDSVQLLAFAGSGSDLWLDIGTGGGFPGLAIAMVVDRPVKLVEPRRRRADFLRVAAAQLGASSVSVEPCRVESVSCLAGVISARAVAPVEKLLHAAAGCATPATRWLLPRGRITAGEIATLRRRNGDKMFHVEQSVTDPQSSIVIVTSPSIGR